MQKIFRIAREDDLVEKLETLISEDYVINQVIQTDTEYIIITESAEFDHL